MKVISVTEKYLQIGVIILLAFALGIWTSKIIHSNIISFLISFSIPALIAAKWSKYYV